MGGKARKGTKASTAAHLSKKGVKRSIGKPKQEHESVPPSANAALSKSISEGVMASAADSVAKPVDRARAAAKARSLARLEALRREVQRAAAAATRAEIVQQPSNIAMANQAIPFAFRPKPKLDGAGALLEIEA